MIDPKTLLDRTINYGLYYTCHFLTTGNKLAIEILNENIERDSIKVGIPVKLGFHSRPSLLLAKIVQHYGGEVQLCVNEDRFDASSVLDIQWAGGKIQKENIRQKGMQHHLETKVLRKNKKPLDVDITISVLKNQEGKLTGSIGIIKDITERKIDHCSCPCSIRFPYINRELSIFLYVDSNHYTGKNGDTNNINENKYHLITEVDFIIF